MKMIRLILVAVLMTMSISGYAQSQIYGDVNGDGEVNIADVNEVVNVILGNYQPINLLGCWYSEYFVDEDGTYNIPDPIAVGYEFDGDNTGQYSYSENGVLMYIGLRWNLQGQRLYIWYDDDDYEELYCRIDENGYLLLSLDAFFIRYTAYRPINGSNAPGIGMNAANDSKDIGKDVIESLSRAIKERINTED